MDWMPYGFLCAFGVIWHTASARQGGLQMVLCGILRSLPGISPGILPKRPLFIYSLTEISPEVSVSRVPSL